MMAANVGAQGTEEDIWSYEGSIMSRMVEMS